MEWYNYKKIYTFITAQRTTVATHSCPVLRDIGKNVTVLAGAKFLALACLIAAVWK
jgi:hypothetical protein